MLLREQRLNALSYGRAYTEGGVAPSWCQTQMLGQAPACWAKPANVCDWGADRSLVHADNEWVFTSWNGGVSRGPPPEAHQQRRVR